MKEIDELFGGRVATGNGSIWIDDFTTESNPLGTSETQMGAKADRRDADHCIRSTKFRIR